MHSVLGVHPFSYIFYAFFNVINPILAIIYAYLGIKILRLEPPKVEIRSPSWFFDVTCARSANEITSSMRDAYMIAFALPY